MYYNALKSQMKTITNENCTIIGLYLKISGVFIETRPIMELFMEEEQHTGSRVDKRCWIQEILELKRMRTYVWEAERMEGGEETDGTVMKMY